MRLDEYGLPITDCSRCGGTGHHSWNQLHGSRCYGCNGTKVKWTAAAAKQVELFTADRAVANSVLAVDVKIGDTIRPRVGIYGKPKTVLAIKETECGEVHFQCEYRGDKFAKTEMVELLAPFAIAPYAAAAVAAEIKKAARAEAKAAKAAS